MKSKATLTLISLIFFMEVMGQTSATTDSLEIVLKTVNNDTALVQCLNDLCSQYAKINNTEKACLYADSAFNTAKTIGDRKGIIQDYFNLGNLNYSEEKNSDALDDYKEVLKISGELEEIPEIASVQRDFGLVYE